MTQIKSYLSLESVPSQQFRSPPAKINLHTMTTNNSLSFSNTIGSFDNRSGGNRKAMYRSNQLFKNISYQTRDHVQQQDQIDNESAITLSPAVSSNDVAEIINVLKMVAFMGKQTQERQVLIDKKTKSIKEIQAKIYLLSEKIGFQKKQFVKKEKTLKSKSLSISKYKKKASQALENQLMEMKLEIHQMKRTISSKKCIGSNKHVVNAKKGISIGTEKSKRQKIYVPIPIPGYANDSMYPNLPLTHRQSRKSDYLAFHHNQSNYALNYPQYQSGRDHSVCYSYENKQLQPQFATFGKRTISNDMYAFTGQKKGQNQMSGKKILDIIQQKLQLDFNIKSQDSRPKNIINIQSHHNPQIQQSNAKTPMQILGLESKDFRSNADFNSNSQSIHINVLKQAERQGNLDYFHDNDINEEMRQSQKSKKQFKNAKQTKGLTNTWKKDKQDEEIVQLLKKSISLQNQKQKPRANLNPPKRSELGAKLIVTNIGPEQSSFDMALPEKSRQLMANGSQVDIFVDSEQRSNSNSKSLQSKKKVSTKRQNIMNSSIGIVLHDMSDSQDDSPVKLENKGRSPNKTSIVKQISIISQALEESQPNTPVPEDLHPANLNLEPSIQSRFTETVRQTNLKDQIEMMASLENLPEKKSWEQIHTPPLSRPPSLLEPSHQMEQEYSDDMIDSIKLSASSKIIESPSKFNSKTIIKGSNHEGQDDFLGEIRLVAMSKISREKSANDHTQLRNQSAFQDPSIVDKMTFSEVAPAPGTIGDDQEDMGLVNSQFRQSSRSVIVKKGSAIQKSATRLQSPNLKNSSKVQSGSQLTGKSGDLSTPIEQQAEDEQDEISSIVRKHKRNVTDLN